MGRSANAFIHFGVALPEREDPNTYEDRTWVEDYEEVLNGLGVDPNDGIEDETLFYLLTGEKPEPYNDGCDAWNAQGRRRRKWKEETKIGVRLGGHCDGDMYTYIVIEPALYGGEVGHVKLELEKFMIDTEWVDKLKLIWEKLKFPPDELDPSWL